MFTVGDTIIARNGWILHPVHPYQLGYIVAEPVWDQNASAYNNDHPWFSASPGVIVDIDAHKLHVIIGGSIYVLHLWHHDGYGHTYGGYYIKRS